MVFVDADQQILRLSQKDAVIADVAVGDLLQDAWPGIGVKRFVFGHLLRVQPDHECHSLHRVSSFCPVCGLSRTAASSFTRGRESAE